MDGERGERLGHRDHLDQALKYYKQASDIGIFRAAFHPYTYAKTLIRLNYEPFDPIETAHNTLELPDILEYVEYLEAVDGYSGCYSGVIPSVIYYVIRVHVHKEILHLCPISEEQSVSPLVVSLAPDNVRQFLIRQVWNLIGRMASTIISQPFYVMMVQTMAKFVDREVEKNVNPCNILVEIYATDGLKGFFSGLFPRLVRDITYSIVWSGVFIACVKACNLMKIEPSVDVYIPVVADLIANTHSSEFKTIGDIMIVNGASNLALSRPPHSKQKYPNWYAAWRETKKKKQLKRSPGMPGIRRKYHGPVSRDSDGRLKPIDRTFGPTYLPRHGANMTKSLQELYNQHANNYFANKSIMSYFIPKTSNTDDSNGMNTLSSQKLTDNIEQQIPARSFATTTLNSMLVWMPTL